MNIKNKISFFSLLVLAIISMVSCSKDIDEFLDKPPGTDVTEDTVFSTKKNIESFLFGTYAYGIHSYYPYFDLNGGVNANPAMCMIAPMTDEAEMSANYYVSQDWNTGSIRKNDIKNQEDARFDMRWQAIRRCNILIERLPEATVLTEEEKKHYAGEALFIRALNNFEMFKRYGTMPIVDHRMQITDEMKIPRATLKDFIDFILKDCNDAAEDLKGVSYPSGSRGRITRTAALALKSRLLLYAASPLFNRESPILSYDHPELVCYGNYDANRWKLAADAAQEALLSCQEEGFIIVDSDTPEEDYRTMWESYDNSEIILAEKFTGSHGSWDSPWEMILPAGLGMYGWNGVNVPQNFIYKYSKKDGTKMEWNTPGIEGDDLMQKYAQLEPRFRQTIAYNGSRWNGDYGDMQLYEGASGNSPRATYNITGYFMHKLIPYSLDNGAHYLMHSNAMLFRVGELYLNLAEALNEYEASPSQQVYDAVGVIRDRAGLPNLPAGLSKEEMRDRIKNERDVELCFEDHRFWDIRRWLDAEKDGVMRGTFYKMHIIRKSGSGLNQKCNYIIEPYETRTFTKKMYLHPIPENEVNKGYLFQNPGW